MEGWTLPLEQINSAVRFVVYSAERGLLSEHTFQGDALTSLTTELTQNPASKAGMYERNMVWIRLL